MRESQGGRFGRHVRPTDVLCWRVLKCTVDHAGPVEAGDHRHPPGDSRRPEPAHFLQPPHVQLDVRPGRDQRAQPAQVTPGEVAAEVGLGMNAGLAFESGRVGRDGQPQDMGRCDDGSGDGRARLWVLHPPSGRAIESCVNDLALFTRGRQMSAFYSM